MKKKTIALALGTSLLAACAASMPMEGDRELPAVLSPAAEPQIASLGNEIAIRAIAMVGHPYRYGGADLNGFDCSGLVFFIHEQLGMQVPRTAMDQQKAALKVSRRDLEPGDLLFFRTRGRAISHVGVYVGDNRFVHAPQSGRLIELRSIDDEYYGRHLVALGRLWVSG